jgi:ribosome maturation factor RimP
MSDLHARLSRIEAVASPVLEAHGLTLVDLEWRREGRRWVLRFYVDKSGGVGIADCQRFSREMGDVLDVSGLISEPYDLEVSSPGLDRELKSDREFAWAVGKEVRCWVREPLEGRRELAGVLVAVTPEALTVAESGQAAHAVPRRLLDKARLVPVLFSRKQG